MHSDGDDNEHNERDMNDAKRFLYPLSVDQSADEDEEHG
jgi:hypothetical protein